METARRIEDHNVVSVVPCMFNSCFCDIYGILFNGENLDTDFFSVDFQTDCCGTVNVAGCKGLTSFALELCRNLCCRVVLPAPRRPAIMMTVISFPGFKVVSEPIRFYKFLVYDLDHHLT